MLIEQRNLYLACLHCCPCVVEEHECEFSALDSSHVRISDTIWTPLLFEAVMGMVEDEDEDATRFGRGIGVRRAGLRDAERVGKVLERVTEGVEFETENLPGWKPAR